MVSYTDVNCIWFQKNAPLHFAEASLPGSFSAQFDCEVPGLHSVNVFHKKGHIEGSPFPLRVKPKCE